jgi:hypothetical protein
MKIIIQISILKTKEDLSHTYIDIVENFISFTPTVFYFNAKSYKWSANKVNQLIKKSDDFFSLIIQSENDFDSIVITGVNSSINYIPISITCEYDLFQKNINKLESMFINLNRHFVSCFVFNHAFSHKQNATYETDLTLYGFSNEINNVSFIVNQYGERVIDNTNNIGKTFLLKESYFVVSPIIYVGRNFEKIIPLDILIKFVAFEKFRMLSENILEVVLFLKIEDTENDDNIKKLSDLYKYLEVKKIVERCK